MSLSPKNKGNGKIPSRVSSIFCLLGVCCFTWELGRLIGSKEGANAFSVESAAAQKGVGDDRAARIRETKRTVAGDTPLLLSSEKGGNSAATTDENHAATDEQVPAALPVEETVPVEVLVEAPVEEEQDRLHPDRFWKAYAADRYSLLTRGVVATSEENEDGSGGAPATATTTAGDSPRVHPTKYLVFANTCHGLGNHMAGMMSAFALSVATERVFLHDWIEPAGQVAARYDELFVPPFEPWGTSAATGSPVSGPDGLLGAVGDNTGNGGGGAHRSALGEEEGSAMGGEKSWVKPPELSATKEENERCRLELTPGGGVKKGFFNKVFITKRGEDPMPDCPVIFVFTNQYLVEMVSSPGYGSSKVGGILISEWLASGRASQTLFPGLFRPVAAVRQRFADESAHLFPAEGKMIAGHARSFHLKSASRNNKFVECLGQLARAKNASTVLLATDMGNFQEYAASRLRPSGVNVVMMGGVERSGEGTKMRNTLEKIQMALTEMLLVGEAGFVVTSPRSSFSAIAAARGGASTERYGGISCQRQVNDPEFHSLECAKTEWRVDQVPNPAEWSKVYSFVDSNRKRCKG